MGNYFYELHYNIHPHPKNIARKYKKAFQNDEKYAKNKIGLFMDI